MKTPQDILSLLLLAQEERRLIQQGHRIEIDSITPAIEELRVIIDFIDAQKTVMTIFPKEVPEPEASAPAIEPVPPPSVDPVPSEAGTPEKPKKK